MLKKENKELKNLNKNTNDFFEIIQEKGDIVFVPRKTAHAVLNLDKVMGAVIETKILI